VAAEKKPTEMTAQELYRTYAAWTGQLHYYAVKHLGRHIDCEYNPDSYEFRIFSGHAEDGDLSVWAFRTVPTLVRPPGEERAVIRLPKPEENPTSEQLDEVFRQICLAAARVLNVDLDKPKLAAPEKSMLISKKRKNESPRTRRRNLGPGPKKD
jgi:hypothetical protein